MCGAWAGRPHRRFQNLDIIPYLVGVVSNTSISLSSCPSNVIVPENRIHWFSITSHIKKMSALNKIEISLLSLLSKVSDSSNDYGYFTKIYSTTAYLRCPLQAPTAGRSSAGTLPLYPRACTWPGPGPAFCTSSPCRPRGNAPSRLRRLWQPLPASNTVPVPKIYHAIAAPSAADWNTDDNFQAVLMSHCDLEMNPLQNTQAPWTEVDDSIYLGGLIGDRMISTWP